MARVNINILGISELKWTRMGEFNSDDHYIYDCGQESLRRNGVAIIVNKRAQNAVLGCNLINDRMISVRFQGKAFSITVINPSLCPTSNAEKAEVEWFYEDLQDLLELTSKKGVLFIIGRSEEHTSEFQSSMLKRAPFLGVSSRRSCRSSYNYSSSASSALLIGT